MSEIHPIDAEVLRTHLEAVGREAGLAIEQTAISTVVSESKDYSVSILDADGRLIVPVGVSPSHFGAAIHGVNATLARYADIGAGDVFIANDPHDGGGLHPQDVVIQRPVFVDGGRVAWVAITAHMMDMGGMVPGSSASEATECFQEALRFPPVRLLRAGCEVSEVWDILRTNVRMADVIEMDLRSLVVGTFVAHEKLVTLIGKDGPDSFAATARVIDDATGLELRRRIAALDDGVYRAVGWAERVDELHRIPCELTIAGDTMRFDFTGAPPQIPNYINSKDFIVRAVTVPVLHTLFGADLPLTQSVYDAFDLVCPAGSIVNAQSPAPIGAAHLDVGQVAAGVAFECAAFALAASDDGGARAHLGAVGYGPRGTCRWSYADVEGRRRTFTLVEGSFAGSPAAHDRDGLDLSKTMHRGGSRLEFADVEVLESTFPILVLERRTRRDAFGAGEFRSGLGCHEALTPAGTELVGYMSGSQSWWPTPGFAGGLPGATTAFQLTRADGTVESVGMQAVAVVLAPGDRFDTRCATGGGFGDPLARRPDRVAADVDAGRLSAANAFAVHGVVVTDDGGVDVDATEVARAARLRDRLARATAPRKPAPPHPLAPSTTATATDDELPLFPGVVQRGAWAFSSASGACLAVAPDHWSDGCPVLEVEMAGRDGRVVVRAYLDPVTGQALHAEVVPPGTPCTFGGGPSRWLHADPTPVATPAPG